MKIITTNKSASFEYFIEEKYEAGIVLEGNEIKSIREGNVNMNDSFCFVRGSDVSVKNMHIALYDKSDAFSTKETRRCYRWFAYRVNGIPFFCAQNPRRQP